MEQVENVNTPSPSRKTKRAFHTQDIFQAAVLERDIYHNSEQVSRAFELFSKDLLLPWAEAVFFGSGLLGVSGGAGRGESYPRTVAGWDGAPPKRPEVDGGQLCFHSRQRQERSPKPEAFVHSRSTPLYTIPRTSASNAIPPNPFPARPSPKPQTLHPSTTPSPPSSPPPPSAPH